MEFTVPPVGAQHKWDSMENKPTRSPVVALGKTLSEMPQSLWADRWRGQGVYGLWWPSVTEGKKKEANGKLLQK